MNNHQPKHPLVLVTRKGFDEMMRNPKQMDRVAKAMDNSIRLKNG